MQSYRGNAGTPAAGAQGGQTPGPVHTGCVPAVKRGGDSICIVVKYKGTAGNKLWTKRPFCTKFVQKGQNVIILTGDENRIAARANQGMNPSKMEITPSRSRRFMVSRSRTVQPTSWTPYTARISCREGVSRSSHL